MKKLFYILAITGALSCATQTTQAQGLLKKVQQVSKDVKTVKGVLTGAGTQGGTTAKTDTQILKEALEITDTEGNDNATSKKSSSYTGAVGPISFFTGSANPNVSSDQGVSTIDLSQPFAMNAYLEDAIYNIKAHHEKTGKYGFIAPVVVKKYYIDGELIVTYSDNIGQDTYKSKTVVSDVIVPANQYEFEDNKMRVGVLAHVFSSLNTGTHKFKIEYCTVINTPVPSSTGSAATEYKNEELLLASGEVDVKIDANVRDTYCKNYGRPKYGKGVLTGQAQLEKQIATMLAKETKHQPVYVYANDNWTYKRGALDRIISREVEVYYIFKNDTGRCELADFTIHQNYNGSSYDSPTYSLPRSRAFKYVSCQNY